MSSEKEETNFGHDVAKMMIFCVLTLGVVKFTFGLFEPHFVSACVVDPAPVDPAES